MASEPIDQRKEEQHKAAGLASAKAAEKQRLAAALRENLRRRKAQRQARSGNCPTETTD